MKNKVKQHHLDIIYYILEHNGNCPKHACGYCMMYAECKELIAGRHRADVSTLWTTDAKHQSELKMEMAKRTIKKIL